MPMVFHFTEANSTITTFTNLYRYLVVGTYCFIVPNRWFTMFTFLQSRYYRKNTHLIKMNRTTYVVKNHINCECDDGMPYSVYNTDRDIGRAS